MAPVPNVIHSHEPEPLTQLAKQVQESTKLKVTPASPHHCLTQRLAKTK